MVRSGWAAQNLDMKPLLSTARHVLGAARATFARHGALGFLYYTFFTTAIHVTSSRPQPPHFTAISRPLQSRYAIETAVTLIRKDFFSLPSNSDTDILL